MGGWAAGGSSCGWELVLMLVLVLGLPPPSVKGIPPCL